MALSNQEISTLSDQLLSATLNGDHVIVDALLTKIDGDSDILGTMAKSVSSRLAENGVSTESPVGKMLGALGSQPDLRLRFLVDRNAVFNEYGLVGDELQAIDLDDQDMEAVHGAAYTNP